MKPTADARFAGMLSPEKGYIFRLTHVDNVASILQHGVRSKNAAAEGMQFTPIGLDDLIERRTARRVLVGPGGTLADYVPFYFTPCTPMAHNILTGRGVRRRARTELVYLLSSLDAVQRSGQACLITDRHAKLDLARFAADRSLLATLPWDLWRTRDFKRDPDDLGKLERYQAEALVHQSLPVAALEAIITGDKPTQAHVEQLVTASGTSARTLNRSFWFPG